MSNKEEIIQKIEILGGKRDPDTKGDFYWLNGHCIWVKEDGTAEEM